VTDYDCLFEEDVTIEMVVRTMNECLAKVLRLLELGLPRIGDSDCGCIAAAEGCGAL